MAADRGARDADPLLLVRAAQHEVHVRATDLGAVLEQDDVGLLGVLGALLETLGYRRQTHFVAPHALVDALPDDGSDEVERGSRHVRPSGEERGARLTWRGAATLVLD